MKTALRTIRIIVIILLAKSSYCQDGFNQDLLRLQQYAVNSGQTEAVTNYNTNFMQREPNGQVSLYSGQYSTSNDGSNNDDYSRAGRSRKVYRIKNPFQQQPDEEKTQQDTNISQDSAIGASNQYVAMQYSLPPEEFLQQMRAENQQQQQQQQQFSTQAPTSPYAVTPQPQYQISTIPASNYDVNQQSNQLSTIEPKAFTSIYQLNSNSYQHNNQNTYNSGGIHSTPTPPYMATMLPNDQYTGPPNTYISSSSPIYLSSPQSPQQYVSSPFSNTHTGTFDYNNNRVTTVGSNSLGYETRNDLNKRMQIDHYDNSAYGVRYPDNLQNQYQSEFSTSTTLPTSLPYSESFRDVWQNSLNTGYKPEPSYSQTQYQAVRYNSNQQDSRFDTDGSNSDTHRIGTLPSANNLVLNFIPPDYQFLNNLKGRVSDSKPESSQLDVYSYGDYGWKLNDKKSSLEPDASTNTNYFKYQIHSVQPDTGAVSQMSFQMDSRKPYNYEQSTKSVLEKQESEEFARAAVRAHEHYKQQLEANKYFSNNQYHNNILSNSFEGNSYPNNDKQRNKIYGDNSNSFTHTQSDIVTASPIYYMNTKDNSNNKPNQSFDHNKALKNIVPIDVSNIVKNPDSQIKLDIDTNRYSNPEYSKDNTEYTIKQHSKQELFYKDKDAMNTFNIHNKPEDLTVKDKLKHLEQNIPYQDKLQTSASFYNRGPYTGNRYFNEESSQSLKLANQISKNHQDPSSINIHQLEIQRPQSLSDINDILKINDIPYRLTQNLYSNKNFDQNNIPTPLPIQINQNVDNHNIDIAAEILSKLIANKHSINRPELETHPDKLLSTINGFKVVNPFNVDLKLVAEMLKGKSTIDDSQMSALRGEFVKPLPIKFDVSQLQQLLQFKNDKALLASNNGLGSYIDVYNSGRFPYQGSKYSRSEEDTENIPIADSSNNHPIGAVIEEDDAMVGLNIPDLTESAEDISTNMDEDKNKNMFNSNHRLLGEKHIHSSVSYSGRHAFKRKYPKSNVDEPYPLLKPPAPNISRLRGTYLRDKNNHRRRNNKPKMHRIFKSEPLFESNDDDIKHPIHLKRSHTLAAEKSDGFLDDENT